MTERTTVRLIQDGLRLVVAEHQKRRKGRRILPRISKATGGPMPGMELTDLAALQEIDDLGYFRRSKNLE